MPPKIFLGVSASVALHSSLTVLTKRFPMEDPPNEQISDKRQKLDDDDSAFLETPDDASAMKAFTNQVTEL